jgi:hypothetical protein
MASKYNLLLEDLPIEMQRGLRLASATRNSHLREFIILTLYEAIDRALAGRIDWRSGDARTAPIRNLPPGAR